MTSAARRTVGVLLLALAASLLVVGPAPAAGTTPVTGTVTIAGDPSTPVNGYVYFYQEPWSSAGGVALTNGAFTAPTLADGDYKIRVLVTTMDNRSVWYAGPGNPAGVETIDQAPLVTLDGTALDLTMELARIGRVTGTVTRAGGAPVGQISVQRSRQGVVASAITNAQGEFDFGYVRPSPPNLSVSVNAGSGLAGDQQSVTVPATGEVVVDLVMVEEARIGGTLVDEDSGDPIEYLSVSAFRKADQAYIGGDRTDADGRFAIGGLGETGYVLRYADDLGGYPQTWNGGTDLLVDAPPLTPTAGATLTHDEALTQVADPCQQPDSCLLSGVVEAGSGAPLAAIDVTAYDADRSARRQRLHRPLGSLGHRRHRGRRVPARVRAGQRVVLPGAGPGRVVPGVPSRRLGTGPGHTGERRRGQPRRRPVHDAGPCRPAGVDRSRGRPGPPRWRPATASSSAATGVTVHEVGVGDEQRQPARRSSSGRGPGRSWCGRAG